MRKVDFSDKSTNQMSEAVVAPDCSITSGATRYKIRFVQEYEAQSCILQYGLPTTASLFEGAVALLATPKSASLTHPSLFVNILAPLISRWMTPCSWRYTRPSRTCDIYTATRFSGNFPNFLHMLCRDPFSQNLKSVKCK